MYSSSNNARRSAMRRSLKALVACTAALLVMALPATASAASRYVTPTGSAASGCTSIDPCTLAHAIELAQSGDDISLSSGIYGLSALLLISTPNVDVHGAGLELTRLEFSSASGLSLIGTGSQVRDLTVDTTGSGFGSPSARRTESSCSGCSPTTSMARGRRARAASFGPRCVTACAGPVLRAPARCRWTARGRPRYATPHCAASASPCVREDEHRGCAEHDRARRLRHRCGGGVRHREHLVLQLRDDHPRNGQRGRRQSDAAAAVSQRHRRDFHQAPSSPTRGAGTRAAVVAGELDLDREGRPVGAADIGADEEPAGPLATTGRATATTSTVTLNGIVDAQGPATTWYFDVSGPDRVRKTTTVTLPGSAGPGR